ncbi:unnamed protein product [Fusarium graminearum]|uniref:Uncharacterized protein n=1 Tax=Gibberella zeae TaxID=5518 RepID=A0A2H3FYZ9_GIBZA|nr:hypothetical protein HG531_013602 [Fusarium graminearum]PCD24085.1 hypothetical protein FGRA07_11440 [Fusarium graminearum]CAG1975232.1 unnamed protein product [Fusarium graminearum]CAG2005771.1 unnamed protein product [Fusarium graminearum]CZS83063.1 unnamed protein product [Fusarium graminearum]
MNGLFSTRRLAISIHRNARLLHLRHRHRGHGTSISGNGCFNPRWQPKFQPKQQSTSLTRSYGTLPDASEIYKVIDAELARRGDFRRADEISDPEFNELYLQKFSHFHQDDEEPDTIPLKPQMYNIQSSSWVPSSNKAKPPERGRVLKIASWKLLSSTPTLAALRTSAAIAHLRSIFGKNPHNLVVMLQQINQEVLEVILKDKWAQQNFVLSDKEPPYVENKVDKSGGDKGDLKSSQYFTIMMISRNLPISNCFRLPLESEIKTDALVVDVPLPVSENDDRSNQSLRLCTTCIESNELDFEQLSEVSYLLIGMCSGEQSLVGGLVGGYLGEKDFHREVMKGYDDVWDDESSAVPPVSKSSQKDITSGKGKSKSKGKGNKGSPHSDKTRKGEQLDTFLYTGLIETVALKEAQATTGRLGRFGTGLKTKSGSDNVGVSDHFGITVGIKVIERFKP